MRHQTAPEGGMLASWMVALRSSRMAPATARRSLQPGQAATWSASSPSGVRPALMTSRSSPSRGQVVVSATVPTTFAEQAGELLPCAVEERLHVAALDADDAGDLVMREALAIRQPEELLLFGLQLGHGPFEVGAVLHLIAVPVMVGRIFGHGCFRMAAFVPSEVAGQVRGDAEERVAAVALRLVVGRGAVEAVVRLLQQ